MLEELWAVLPSLSPETARADARRAILTDDIFRRPSLTSRQKVFKKLGERYLLSGTPAATALFVRALKRTSDPTEMRLLAYVMLLWTDALVYTLSTRWLAPKLTGPRFEADTGDIERELEWLANEVPDIAGWSQVTRKRIAQHYLGILRDCGLATGAARKLLRRPFVPPTVVLFGAQLITGSGERAESLPEHPLFRALGLDTGDVIEALTQLRREGRIEYASQGGIVHFAVREEATP